MGIPMVMFPPSQSQKQESYLFGKGLGSFIHIYLYDQVKIVEQILFLPFYSLMCCAEVALNLVRSFLKRNFGYVVPISSFIFSFTAGIKQLNMAV
jgi:hypothetical protein